MSDLSPVKRALIEIERLQEELAAARRRREEPLAIIGLSCRFPGDADDPEAFWALLAGGRDAIVEVPRERWDIDTFYDADAERRGCISSRWGGFLQAIDRFDGDFFAISPREAAAMDPQQRLLLEVAWEALERAGLPAESLAGSATAVYTGVCSADYERLHYRSRDAIDIYSGTGTAANLLAGRLAYVFDWHGPAVTLDTACSSSLVAVHFACQSLRAGECDLALAAGVNLFVLPERHICISRMRMLAPDGRCKTFDARADGFVRSEGCGVVVLRRLGDALTAGDPILAVIRGSAVNQDGRSAGLTAPNGAAQQAVIRQALGDAGVDPADVDYVEAHGAGTSLGDPIEVEALASLYGHPSRHPCVLGAVKTNIGHAEAAAGVAGLIKTVLALQHEMIPRNLHFERANPNLPVEGTRLEVAGSLRPWPRGARPRYAAVSSFGWSGTNAHVVLAEAPAGETRMPETRESYLLPVSARTPEALREMTTRYAACLEIRNVGDVVFTAGARRSHHRHRVAVVGRTAAEMASALREVDIRDPIDGSGPVFVYSGQGGQWAGMGAELYDAEPVFRQVIDEYDEAIRAQTGWSLVDAMRSRTTWDEIDRVQPALLALGAGLTALWRHWGVRPSMVVGHSLGEVIAAHAAGALTRTDAVEVMCVRSGLLKRIGGHGAMAVIELGRQAAETALAACGGRVTVAASNSDRSTVLAGETAAMDVLIEEWERRGVHCRRVQVDVASHGPQVDGLLVELQRRLAAVKPRNGATPMISTVTADVLSGEQLGAAYWARNLRAPVRFADAMHRLVADGYRSFVEIGPHPTLVPSIQDALGKARGVVVASLRRGEPERETLLTGAGALYRAGADLTWPRVNGNPGSCIVLPAYPWQRSRHWLEEPGEPGAQRGAGYVSVPGEREVHVWQIQADSGHAVLGRHVMPAATYMERALWASRQVLGPKRWELRDLLFICALDAGRHAQLVIEETVGGLRFGVSSRTEGERRWQTHASARLVEESDDQPEPLDLDAIRNRCTSRVSETEFYRRFSEQGVEYGASMRQVIDAWIAPGETLTRLGRPNLDACLQGLCWAAGGDAAEIRVPVGAARATLSDAFSRASWAWARWRNGTGHVLAATSDGRVVAEVEGVRLARLAAHADDWLWEVRWHRAERPAPRALTGRWRIVGGEEDEEAAKRLREYGAAAEWVPSDRANVAVHSLSGIVWIADRDDIERIVLLIQTLEQHGSRDMSRLVLVTRGTQPAGDGPRAVEGAELWGLAQVIRHEHPTVQVLCVDLPAVHDVDALQALAEEIASCSGETHVALRGDARYVARLARFRPAAAAPTAVSANATYLITGGLGGIGLTVSERLIERGARHLALIGRSGPSEPSAQRLRALDADVRFFRADVAVRDEIAAALEEVSRSMPPVRGIMHAAGVLDDVTLLHLTPERLAGVMRPKVAGAWNLHELSGGFPLDFFVLFSTAVSVLGAPGQASHAAANAHLDALAHFRRSQKLPALSVNWGRWANVGPAATRLRADNLGVQGIGAMPPADALDLLDLLMAADCPQAVAMSFNFRQWCDRFPQVAALPLFAGLDGQSPRPGVSPIGATLGAMDQPERIRALVEIVRTRAERVMRLAAGSLSDGMSFFDRGLDSMTALEIRNGLEDLLALTIPATAIWRHPTASNLAAYLADELVPPGSPAAPDVDPSLALILEEAARLDIRASGDSRPR